jgi:hypothetical protein
MYFVIYIVIKKNLQEKAEQAELTKQNEEK